MLVGLVAAALVAGIILWLATKRPATPPAQRTRTEQNSSQPAAAATSAPMTLADRLSSCARELSAAERQGLETQVGKLTGKKVRARYSQDKSLLGGAVIKVGSTIYDGSILGQLNKLREQLSAS